MTVGSADDTVGNTGHISVSVDDATAEEEGVSDNDEVSSSESV